MATNESTPSDNNSVSDSLKIMADKHAIIRSHLDEASQELISKNQVIRELEARLLSTSASISMSEQNLSSLTQKLYIDDLVFQDLEKRNHELIQESVQIDWNVEQIQEKMVKLKDKIKSEEMKEFKAKVEEVSKDLNEVEVIEKKIDELMKIKDRLAHNDEELSKLLSGQTLQILEAQKLAIMEAYSDQESDLEQLQEQLSEKEQEIAQVRQSIKIQEKQNQARSLKMHRQLAELEESEKQLKSTAQFMESQIDFGVK